MKVLVTGGKEPIAEKAVWDFLAFAYNFIKVKTLVLDGDTPTTQHAAKWAASLNIDVVNRAASKGKPDLVVAFCADQDALEVVNKAKVAGIRVYELNNV